MDPSEISNTPPRSYPDVAVAGAAAATFAAASAVCFIIFNHVLVCGRKARPYNYEINTYSRRSTSFRSSSIWIRPEGDSFDFANKREYFLF